MTADAVGGVWTYALELCRELGRCDVHVVLSVMGPPPSDAQRAQAERIPTVRLESAPYKLEWMRDPWCEVDAAGAWLQSLAERVDTDLVHLNGYTHAARPWRSPVLVVAHSCVCSWWRAVHGGAPPAEWDAYRRNVGAGLRAADHVVAPTRAFLEELQYWHAPMAPSSVIYNARTQRPFASARNTERESMIFTCGRMWDEAKNVGLLDEASRGLPWPAYVAGAATAPEGADSRTRSLHALGALAEPELARWLKRAAIYAHPARYEPFGLSVLEAALAGCALVLADLPSLRELWSGAALFAPAND
ncbi:MAG TPA: glycosyltransferase family 4 protein, partial [Steroidobacter sp.]|nr:glycosyltransferase family 4 protein [Steroidobacter sp.]